MQQEQRWTPGLPKADLRQGSLGLGRQALVHYPCFSFKKKKNKNYHSVLY